LDNNVF